MAAVALLADWDKSWRVDDKGFYGPAPTLMEAFVDQLQRQVFLDDVGEDQYYRFAATGYPKSAAWGFLGNVSGDASFGALA